MQFLLATGAVVICAGGGGALVIRGEHGHLMDVQAVVYKNYVSARVAFDVNADRLLILTDVPAFVRDFDSPDARPIGHLDVGHHDDLHLPDGSMGPKAQACAQFTAATGHPAKIGALNRGLLEAMRAHRKPSVRQPGLPVRQPHAEAAVISSPM